MKRQEFNCGPTGSGGGGGEVNLVGFRVDAPGDGGAVLFQIPAGIPAGGVDGVWIGVGPDGEGFHSAGKNGRCGGAVEVLGFYEVHHSASSSAFSFSI